MVFRGGESVGEKGFGVISVFIFLSFIFLRVRGIEFVRFVGRRVGLRKVIKIGGFIYKIFVGWGLEAFVRVIR